MLHSGDSKGEALEKNASYYPGKEVPSHVTITDVTKVKTVSRKGLVI